MLRSRGHGKTTELRRIQEMAENAVWRPVPGFPEYEVTEQRQVRRVGTKALSQPYEYMLRKGEGEFVEFWVDGRKHVMSLETIMSAVWSKKDVSE
jgi:hypothetical protein